MPTYFLDSSFPSSGAGSSGEVGPLCPLSLGKRVRAVSLHYVRAPLHPACCSGILMLRCHGKEKRYGSCDSGVKPIEPSAVTSHRAVSWRCRQEQVHERVQTTLWM